MFVFIHYCNSERLETEEEKDKAAKADEEEDSQFFNMAQKALKRLDSKTIKSGISKKTKKTSAESPTKSKVFSLRPLVRKILWWIIYGEYVMMRRGLNKEA